MTTSEAVRVAGAEEFLRWCCVRQRGDDTLNVAELVLRFTWPPFLNVLMLKFWKRHRREEIATRELAKWPDRLTAVPPRISAGNLTRITAEDFLKDSEVWKKRVSNYTVRV
ncbi:hypothetical protein U1Q18_033537 [Sarracenia purpurea var. burkii]